MAKPSSLIDTLSQGIAFNQWRSRVSKLAHELNRLQNLKSTKVFELGHQVWGGKFYHPDYAEIFSELQNLDNQRIQVTDQLADLQKQLQSQSAEHQQIQSEIGKKIADETQNKDGVVSQLTEAQTSLKQTGDWLTHLRGQQQQVHSTVQTYQQELAQLQLAPSADQIIQIAALNQQIASHTAQMHEWETQITQYTAIEGQLHEAIPSFQRQIQEHDNRINTLLKESQDRLSPVKTGIEETQQKIQNATGSIKSFDHQISPWIEKLGIQANASRVAAEPLIPAYQQVDGVQDQINRVTYEKASFEARINQADKGTIRNFNLVVGAAVLIILVIIGVAVVLSSPKTTSSSKIINGQQGLGNNGMVSTPIPSGPIIYPTAKVPVPNAAYCLDLKTQLAHAQRNQQDLINQGPMKSASNEISRQNTIRGYDDTIYKIKMNMINANCSN
jgi:uncharacterized coiled-coil DUF342 family protein